jgi:hypothetical protein
VISWNSKTWWENRNGPETSWREVGKTTHGRYSDAYAVNRRGKSRPEQLVAEAAKQIRHTFGTTGDKASRERTCKRPSAKHLEFSPSLLEGRPAFQLSYGRGDYCHRIAELEVSARRLLPARFCAHFVPAQP